jgi:membrane fusion protein (multidrug efflux system)
MKTTVLTLMCAISLLAIPGCGKARPGDDSQPPASVTSVITLHPKKGDITRSLTLPGNVMAWQEATLYAKVAGYLRAIHADIGDTVKKGELLAEIEAPEMLAERLTTEVAYNVAEKEYTRISEARAKASDLVMPQTVDDAKGRLDMEKAKLDRLDTLLAYTRITAPFDGIITSRFADPGAFIPAATSSSAVENAALLQLANFSKVRVEIDVPEVEVSLLKTGVVAHLSSPSLPDLNLTGSITRFAYALDSRTKTMKAELELDNPGLVLRPGMMVEVRLDIEHRQSVLLLPATTLSVSKGKASVFLIRDGRAARTPVHIGFDDGIHVEILVGLTEADEVIDAGRQKVSNDQAVTATPTAQ